MLAHTTCLRQLNYEGYTCKETFREIKHKGSGEVRTSNGGMCCVCSEDSLAERGMLDGQSFLWLSCTCNHDREV